MSAMPQHGSTTVSWGHEPSTGLRVLARRGRRGGNGVLLLVAVLVALLLGLGTAILPTYFAALLGGLLLLPALLIAWLSGRQSGSREWLFLLLLLGLLVLPFLGRVSGFNFGAPWQAAVLLLSLFGLQRFWSEVRQSGWLKFALIAFGLFLVMGIASTMMGHPKWRAVAYQVASDLKPLLLVAFGFALMWDERCDRWLSHVMAWGWLPMAFMVAFQWAAPGPFMALGARSAGMVAPPESSGFLPSRAIGIFEHPSQLAAVSACFAMLIFARWLCSPVRPLRHLTLVFVYLALVVCAYQRQELVALVVGLAVILAVFHPRNHWRNALFLVIAGLSIVLVVALAAPGIVVNEMAKWGFGTVGAVDAPRAQIFIGGWQLARMHFPFGAGLGTFAGAGAEKFNISVYHELGFGRYWWFGKRDYLLDTYWPNSIGESGVIGAIFLLVFYLSLLAYAVVLSRRRVSAQSHAFAIAACGSMVYILLVSLTSPAFQDPRLFAIPAMLFGISVHLAHRHAEVRPA